MFDEMLDWVALNHKLLSMQRLRNLTGRFMVDARLAHDLQIAGVEVPEGHGTRGVDYLPAFAEANDSLLAQLGTAH